MKAGKTISIILATVCCFLVLPSSLQAASCPKITTKTEVQAQYLFSSVSFGDNVAISQPLFEVNFSVSPKKGFEIIQYSFLAICQRMEYNFNVNSEYLKHLINYFIQQHIAGLIFPFHHFW